MADTIHSITVERTPEGRPIRLSMHAPLHYSPGGVELSLDDQSPAFQAVSQAWGKSLQQARVESAVCSPVILNYEGC
jgi:hypothetical protein